MPLVRDPTVTRGKLEELIVFGERVLQIGMSLERPKTTAELDVLIYCQRLCGKKEYKVLEQ